MSSQAQAIKWMLVKTFAAAVMYVLIRHLTNLGTNIYMTAALPIMISVPVMIGLNLLRKRRLPRTGQFPLYFVRGALGISSILLMTYAITLIPLATATAINYTAPLFSVLLAIIILKERPSKRLGLGILGGIAGMLLIIQPNFEAYSLGVIIMTASAFLYGAVNIIVKALVAKDSPYALTFFTWISMLLAALPLTIVHWQTLGAEQWLGIIMLTVVANLSVFAASYAYQKSELSVLMPLEYMQLIFVVVLAELLFAEHVELATIAGGLIIIVSNLVTASNGNLWYNMAKRLGGKG